ncbi:MAG: hypothetical protein LBI56_01780 [Puniceicoccales bacterium]|jgi:hypothetical protein|nr:hypothetical protein [Puniceicoccales bacterium]
MGGNCCVVEGRFTRHSHRNCTNFERATVQIRAHKASNPGTTVALDAIFDEDEESAFYKLLGDCTVKKVTFDISAEEDKIFHQLSFKI